MFIEEASRQEQISVLEAAADRDYDDEDFNYLLAVFDLPIQCIDDLKHLIYSEKWR